MKIVNVHFVNSSIIAEENTCIWINLTIKNSTWYGKSQVSNYSFVSTKQTSIVSNFTRLRIQGSRFYQSVFRVRSLRETDILVTRCNFTNLPDQVILLGGLHLSFLNYKANVTVQNCRFWDLMHPNRIESVINLFESAIWMKVETVKRYDPNSNATVLIKDILFEDNERGLTAIGPYKQLLIQNSIFRRNIAMHAGAGVLVLIDMRSTMILENCTFEENGAGKYRDLRVGEKAGEFEVVKDEVHVDSKCCKGVIEMVGKGGAIRVQRGGARIMHSTFTNNTARLLGGAVFVDRDGTLHLINCSFSNTPSHKHSLQGDILYSDGKVTIIDVSLKVVTARNSLSIFRHSGDHWSLNITYVWMQCPMGYNLRVTNTSAYGVLPVGLRRSHLMDQLSYFCESCPRNKYSLDHGYINYTRKYRAFAYMTLLINGSAPDKGFTGDYVHHEAVCSKCPYGGHCEQGITAVPNYWGYVTKNSVRFQHCPKGYCCDRPNCPSIDLCSKDRVGALCGRCKEGYTEALFSATCVESHKCGPSWLLPFAVLLGFIYTLFLLFQMDLKQFLFDQPIKCERLTRCFRKAIEKTFLTQNVKLQIHLEEGTTFLNNQNGHAKATTIANGSICEIREEEEIVTEKEEFQQPQNSANTDSGFLIILFYYFQDAVLLHVETVFVKDESKSMGLLKNFLSGLFKFRLDLFELIEEVCAISDWGPAPKLLLKAVTVPYVLLLFGLMYILNRMIQLCYPHNKNKKELNKDTVETIPQAPARKTFATRLAIGFILALLFTFQKMASTAFSLLNCVPVDGRQVLFIDGTVTCYETWQYFVLAYALSCVAPFFLVLMVGPALLERGQIGLGQFFFACLCPLPMLVTWLILHCWHKSHKCQQGYEIKQEVQAVIQVLQGPFKRTKSRLCWAGVLIGRRLILILLTTFVNDSLIRLLCMLLVCFVILLHHVHVQPYKDRRGNIAGTASAASLVTLGCTNLVRAGFEAAEYTPTGPNEFLMRVFAEVDNVLLMWFPLCVLFVVVLVLLTRIGSIFSKCFCKSSPQHKATQATEM